MYIYIYFMILFNGHPKSRKTLQLSTQFNLSKVLFGLSQAAARCLLLQTWAIRHAQRVSQCLMGVYAPLAVLQARRRKSNYHCVWIVTMKAIAGIQSDEDEDEDKGEDDGDDGDGDDDDDKFHDCHDIELFFFFLSSSSASSASSASSSSSSSSSSVL